MEINRTHITWQGIENLIQKMCGDLVPERITDKSFIVSISRGGLIPATMLSHMLDIPLKHVIHISSYEGTQQKEIIWDYCPVLSKEALKHAIFVDDIIDTGETVNNIVTFYNPTIKFVTLIGKPEGYIKFENNFLCAPEYVRQDEWIVFPWECK